MTYGIDVAGGQVGLDMVAVAAAGNGFVIVKAVAAYLPEHTVADGYQSNVDRAVTAGFCYAKGHYLVPNSRNTPAQSARFQIDNAYRPMVTDAYMLDNEPLDTYKVYWRDDNAAAYFEELHAYGGIRYDQMWFYCPAFLTRSSGPWPKIEALRKLGLKIVWVSYGDNDPLREDGEEPLLGGGITGWDVHQFTSTYRVPGFDRNVDRMYSPLTAHDLFGGVEVGYSNVNNFVVILADNRDPWVSWANHLARGSAGGVDCVAPIGTPIYAPDDCYLANTPNNGTGGNTITLSFANGWRDQMMHLSRFVSGGSKRKGELVGYSGDSAAPGQPHVHWHRIDPSGARRNPWDYFTGSGTAGGGTTPIEEDDMFTDQDRANLTSVLLALGAGGLKPGGWKDSETVAAAVWDVRRRVENIDRQVTGADAFGNSVAERVIDIQAKVNTGGLDVEAFAAAIVARLNGPADATAIAKAVRAEFASNPLN